MSMLACAVSALLLIAVGGELYAQAEGFTDHGVAAPVSRSRGAAATVDGEGNRVVLVWPSDQRGCTSLLIINADTGATRALELERGVSDSPFAVILSSRNRFYTQFGDRFYEYDAVAGEITFTGATPARCAMAMTEDADGVIWAGLYPGAHLVSFDPDTQELTSYGPLNEETWPQYPRSLAADDEGWIYTGIGTTSAQVVGFSPTTGQIVKYVPEDERPHGTGGVRLATDGKVYGTVPGWGWHLLSGETATPIEGMPPPRAPIKDGSQESVFVDFPDGSRILRLDMPERRVTVRDADGTERELAFDYVSEGSHILSVVLGPDGAIYGSTGHPLRVYRFDPAEATFTHNGLLDLNGHLNAMAVQRGCIFGALYGGRLLYRYDPAQPWQDRDPDEPNPRDVWPSDPNINRPHALIAHPDGRHLVAGGTPGYGRTGGGLFIYDMDEETGVMLSHEELLENLSPFSIVALPNGDLVVGTTTMPGTGGQVKADEAQLFVLDWETRQVVWHEAVVPGVARLTDLILGPRGLVYGIAGNSLLYVFDPETRTVVHEESLIEYGPPGGSQAPRIMVLNEDGSTLYIMFQRAMVAVDTDTYAHRKLADAPVSLQAGIVLLDGRIYFASGSRLYSYALPAEE